MNPADDPASVLEHGRAVDFLLGGPVSVYRQLAEAGRLSEWSAVRPPFVRNDPGRWAVKSLLQAKDWRAAYANLVMTDARPMGGDAIEGVGVVMGSRHEVEAMTFLRSLPDRERPAEKSQADPGVERLVATLLDCVLVESRDELRTAREVLALENHPRAAVTLMTESPPWPPASILRIRAQPDGGALLATLAEQIAPDPPIRAWLVSSWNRDPVPIDGAVLHAIADAAGGGLVAEPRFRSWLRTEWTAWARQRFRRVAIRAGAGDLP